jgi:hypothetical protein
MLFDGSRLHVVITDIMPEHWAGTNARVVAGLNVLVAPGLKPARRPCSTASPPPYQPASG